MAGGAVVQIISIGLQDRALTQNAELTFWKGSYKQYSIFAVESVENIFQSQCDFGKRAITVVGRAGDLMGNTVFQATLPQISQDLAPSGGAVYARWQDFIGEQLVQECSIEIGGNTISKYTGDYMHIWNQLSLPEAKLDAYYKMIGHTTQLTYLTDPQFADINQPCSAASVAGQVCVPRKALPETTLYIKLLFWFCETPSMAIPILALQFHEVRISLSVRPLLECLWAVSSLDASGPTTSNRAVRAAYTQSLVTASLYIDYTFCEVDERKYFVTTPHEYLYDQVQNNGDITVGTASARIPLNLSHPNQEIIFVAQPDVNVDVCASFDAGEPLFNQLGIQPFNYTDAIDALPKAFHAFGSPAALNGAGAFMAQFTEAGISQWGFQQPAGASAAASATNSNYSWGSNATTGQATNGGLAVAGGSTASGGNAYAPFADHGVTSTTSGGTTTYSADTPIITGVSDPAIFVLAETAFKMHCWGENPVIAATLTFTNTNRFEIREGRYFDVVQPFQCHTRAADTGINLYSFALNPEAPQPSGTLNFSRVESPFLQLTLSTAVIYGNTTCKVRCYGRGKNIFRVIGGMGGNIFAS